MSEQRENDPSNSQLTVIKLAHGLGFGDGAISPGERLASDTDELNHEILELVESTIVSDQILVPVEVDDEKEQLVDDDGCGDGRGVKRIFQGGIEKKRSLNRSKVFGGGATMTVGAFVALGRAAGNSLKDTFGSAIGHLKNLKIPFGAHTDDHAESPNCGCGAIDKAPQIIENAGLFRSQITDAIELLSGGDYDRDSLGEVFSNYRSYAQEIAGQPYSGREVMDLIIEDGKVVKQLEGPHRETHIIINTVPNHTVNQELIRLVSGGKAQVFAVDTWRKQVLAAQEHYDSPAEQHKAYLGMLVYTLATAATLTKGDLPVYVVSKQPQPEQVAA